MQKSDSNHLTASLVGCGRIGAFTRPELLERLGPNWLPLSHMDAAFSVPGLDLVSACDPNEDALAALKSIHPQIKSHKELRVLLEMDIPDILLVATRSDVRPTVIRSGVDAGVRGFHCEKPLATSLKLVEACVADMIAANAHFSYGALRRYMGIYESARAAISAGELGDVSSITVKFGRGGLMWVHPHTVDLLCFLNSDARVTSVQAKFVDFEEHRTGTLIDCDPILMFANIHFSNGCIGSIVPQSGLTVDIGGTEEALSIIGDGAFSLRHPYTTGKECTPSTQWKFERDSNSISGRYRALEELCMSVRIGRDGRLLLDNVLVQHRILFGLVQSHLEGSRLVSLDEIDPSLQVTGAVNGLSA